MPLFFMNNFIELYDNALSPDQCDSIIEYINTSSRIKRGLLGDGVDTSRKDSWDVHSRFEDQTVVDTMIHGALCECLDDYKIKNPQLNDIGYWGLENKYNLQKYLPGGGYPKSHCEAGVRQNSHRVAVWMIYLNTVTDDGGTNFPQHNLITDAVQGTAVLWPAGWTHFHHGVISKTQYKYIATGWYSYVPQ